MIALPTLLSAFKAYWNFPSQPCQTNYSIDFLNYSIEANTNLSFYGDKVVIFYEFILGRYPYYKRYDENQPINGGIPQNCSLEEHLNITKENITMRIPDQNYSGLAILDLEEWRPLFDQNSWKEKKGDIRKHRNIHETTVKFSKQAIVGRLPQMVAYCAGLTMEKRLDPFSPDIEIHMSQNGIVAKHFFLTKRAQ
ncbi:hyaluronoglucosaminidase [Ancylostoma caninum]|uniref:Hyaluronidase n=1 Tax=Ancylostoma caninum TaxID=29170 RepID=A0A368FV85_ANCCA|nr:hyaluronoglucosaminidase [Ancylostoma caninum]